MSSPTFQTITRSSSFPSLFKSRTRMDDELRAPQSTFLGYELPSSLRSAIRPSPDRCDKATVDDFSYSPPPSPTLNTFIPRFESPCLSFSIADTPSLLNESLPSTTSSPFLVYTPMPYVAPRAPRPDTTTLVGLGISGLFLQNGTIFDGMGILPRRDERTELGFFMDEADQANNQGGMDGVKYLELEEDAWRKHISSYTGLGLNESLNTHCNVDSPPAFWTPPSASSPFRTYSHANGPLPTEPETDDLFYTRPASMSTSPHSSATRGDRLEISRATVSSWFRNIQSPGLEDGIEERFARVL